MRFRVSQPREIEQRVGAQAFASAEDKNVVEFGANVARQCIDHGLLDEIAAHLAPVLVGGGVRLFGGPGAQRIDLQRTRAGTSGQVTNLRFAVVK